VEDRRTKLGLVDDGVKAAKQPAHFRGQLWDSAGCCESTTAFCGQPFSQSLARDKCEQADWGWLKMISRWNLVEVLSKMIINNKYLFTVCSFLHSPPVPGS